MSKELLYIDWLGNPAMPKNKTFSLKIKKSSLEFRICKSRIYPWFWVSHSKFYANRSRERAAVVHLNFRAGSTFPVPVCIVPSSMDRTSRCNKVDVVRLYASYRLNLLLLKGQRCLSLSWCLYPINFKTAETIGKFYGWSE